ncbi:MAG: sulfite exporter TauE/SafE family protein [Thermoanaerobaculia bacterium]
MAKGVHSPAMLGIETIFDSIPQFMLVCLILAAAEAVYVLLGFGAGLISVGTMALLLPELKDAVVLLLLVSLPAELWVVRSSWRRISWRGVLVIFVGVALGIPLGTLWLKFGEARFLLILLGVFLVAVGGVFLFLRAPRARRLPPWAAAPIGVASGVLTGLFGTGGPPLILYFQLSGTDKAAFRGNLMAIFLLMTTVRVPAYAAFGLITTPRLWSALAVLPAVLLGAVAGNSIHLRIEESTFRRLVSVALLVIGLLLLIPAGR